MLTVSFGNPNRYRYRQPYLRSRRLWQGRFRKERRHSRCIPFRYRESTRVSSSPSLMLIDAVVLTAYRLRRPVGPRLQLPYVPRPREAQDHVAHQ